MDRPGTGPDGHVLCQVQAAIAAEANDVGPATEKAQAKTGQKEWGRSEADENIDCNAYRD